MRPLPGIALIALCAACGESVTLPDATIPVATQQIQLYALSGTPVATPSAYNMLSLIEVRTYQSNDFDFVFDIGIDSTFGLGTNGDTIAVLKPRGNLGFDPDGGLQWMLIDFDSVFVAPIEGYETIKPTRIRTGDTILATSRAQQCAFGYNLPHYAKLLVMDIDLALRKATIRVVIDPNCGYRSLTTGIPTF